MCFKANWSFTGTGNKTVDNKVFLGVTYRLGSFRLLLLGKMLAKDFPLVTSRVTFRLAILAFFLGQVSSLKPAGIFNGPKMT